MLLCLQERWYINSGVNVKSNIKYADTLNNPKDHPIFRDRLIYGFLWVDMYSQPITPDIGYIELFQKVSTIENGIHHEDSIPLELEDWSVDDSLKHPFPRIAEQINHYKCPKYNNYTLKGTQFSKNATMIWASFTKWVGKPECKSDEEIANVISTSSMITILNNTYYDHDDTQSPVKYFLDINHMFPADGFQKSNTYHIRENKFKVYNNYLNPNFNTEGWFYDLDGKVFDFTIHYPHKISYYVVSFFMSDHIKEYESYTYTILDLFSDLGGAFEIFEVFGKLMIGYYVRKLFYHNVVNFLNQKISIIDLKPNYSQSKENSSIQNPKLVIFAIKFTPR